jgi:hypothetical protein
MFHGSSAIDTPFKEGKWHCRDCGHEVELKDGRTLAPVHIEYKRGIVTIKF